MFAIRTILAVMTLVSLMGAGSPGPGVHVLSPLRTVDCQMVSAEGDTLEWGHNSGHFLPFDQEINQTMGSHVLQASHDSHIDAFGNTLFLNGFFDLFLSTVDASSITSLTAGAGSRFLFSTEIESNFSLESILPPGGKVLL